MKLSTGQLAAFDRDGCLFFPALFTPEEAAVLCAQVPRIYAERRPEVVRERDGVTPRTSFAAHMYNRVYARLARHPRLVEPVRQFFGEDVYIHQFKINGKMAFDGDVWQWHQDFGTWQRDDDMPEPRAMNIALFLDEVSEFNGPLMFIPGSHRGGVIAAGHDVQTTSYPLWTIDNATIAALVERREILAPKGAPGCVVMFHGNLVHGSGSNMSPWNRNIVYLSLCAVSNHIRRFKRPGYIAHRDFAPIRSLPDDCLLRDYPVELPWEKGTPPGELQAIQEAA